MNQRGKVSKILHKIKSTFEPEILKASFFHFSIVS